MKSRQDAVGDLAGLERAIAQGSFDAIVVLSPEHIRYVADVHISTQLTIRDRLALLLWPKGRDPIFIICRVEEGDVRRESWIREIRTYREFSTSPITLLAEVMKEGGLGASRIGIELDYLGAKYYHQLLRELPSLRMEACEDLLARVRMLKTPREKEILTRGFRGTEKALLATYVTIEPGETEKSMANRLADNIMRSGAERIAFNHINGGANTGYPHMIPGGYQTKRGDLIKADCGGLYSEYYSNVGRTAKLGPLSEDDRSIWKRLRDIHHRVIDMLRPGRTGREVFEAAARLHEAAGFPFPYGHNGHGIGLQVHEHPMISPHEDIPYAPGMLSTVETRYREAGRFGYHMEDLVEITEGSPVILSDYFDNEEILVL